MELATVFLRDAVKPADKLTQDGLGDAVDVGADESPVGAVRDLGAHGAGFGVLPQPGLAVFGGVEAGELAGFGEEGRIVGCGCVVDAGHRGSPFVIAAAMRSTSLGESSTSQYFKM